VNGIEWRLKSQVFEIQAFHQEVDIEVYMAGHDQVYRLNQNVQVRAEKFGLLFYDRRGPSLFFVGSKNLIEPEFFEGKETPRGLVEKTKTGGLHEDRLEGALRSLLAKLVQKGLIDVL